MEYIEKEFKNHKKYYFLKPKHCYCKTQATDSVKKILKNKTICLYCGHITGKIAKKEDCFEKYITSLPKERLKKIKGKTKHLKINEDL